MVKGNLLKLSGEDHLFIQILKAYRNCLKGKKKSTQVRFFESQLSFNLIQLAQEIENKKYSPSRMKSFIVTHPKPREIFSAHFRDRIVHHIVVRPIEELWEPSFSDQSFACRKGKGVLSAIHRLQKEVKKLSQGGIKTVYALQLDIQSYFVSIDRTILNKLYLKKLQNIRHKDHRELTLRVITPDGRIGCQIIDPLFSKKIIPYHKSWFSQGPTKGIPIGSLTSQFGANLYLNELDHFIQRQLKPSSYLRYMDDLLLLDTNPEKLEPMIPIIDEWLKKHRKIQLHPEKTHLIPLTDGISHLGYTCRQVNGNPHNPLQFFLSKKKKWKMVQELKQLEKINWKASGPFHPSQRILIHPLNRKLARINSNLSHVRHARSYLFRKKALQKFLENITENKNEPDEHSLKWTTIKVKKDFLSLKMK